MRDPFEELRRIQEAIAKITTYVKKVAALLKPENPST